MSLLLQTKELTLRRWGPRLQSGLLSSEGCCLDRSEGFGSELPHPPHEAGAVGMMLPQGQRGAVC